MRLRADCSETLISMDILLPLSGGFALLALLCLIWLAVHAFRKSTLWGFAVLLFSPPGAAGFGIRHWREERLPFLAYLFTLVIACGLGLGVFTSWGGWELLRTAQLVQRGIETGALREQDAYEYLQARLVFIGNADLRDAEERKLEVIRGFLNDHETGLTDARRRQLHAEIRMLQGSAELDAIQHRELEYLGRQLLKTGPQPAAASQPVAAPEAGAAPERTVVRLESKRPSGLDTQYRTGYRIIPISEARHYVGKSFKVTRRDGAAQDCKLIGATRHSLRFEQRGGGGTFVFSYDKRDIEELKLLTRLES